MPICKLFHRLGDLILSRKAIFLFVTLSRRIQIVTQKVSLCRIVKHYVSITPSSCRRGNKTHCVLIIPWVYHLWLPVMKLFNHPDEYTISFWRTYITYCVIILKFAQYNSMLRLCQNSTVAAIYYCTINLWCKSWSEVTFFMCNQKKILLYSFYILVLYCLSLSVSHHNVNTNGLQFFLHVDYESLLINIYLNLCR